MATSSARARSGLTAQPARRAYEQVADQLRELILSGSLTIGDRLPTEAELCARFKTSRSTIREALRLLSSQSLITTRPGASGGSSVAHPQPGEIVEFLHTTLGLLAGTGELTVDELLQARELLEVPAARMAAKHNAGGHVEQLASLVPRRLGDLDRQTLFDVNHAFHQTILLASGNRILHLMTEPIFTVLQTRFLRDEATPEFWARVGREHRRIVRALEEGDPDEAADAMEAHLRQLAPTYKCIDMARQEQDGVA